MKKPFSIKARLKSFKYAGEGIFKLLKGEHNAWIHSLAIVVVSTAGILFGITRNEWIAVILCFALVLAAEAFNTAIEKLVDLTSPKWNSQSCDIKDIAAGGVLICAIAAAIIGFIVFIPYIINLTI